MYALCNVHSGSGRLRSTSDPETLSKDPHHVFKFTRGKFSSMSIFIRVHIFYRYRYFQKSPYRYRYFQKSHYRYRYRYFPKSSYRYRYFPKSHYRYRYFPKSPYRYRYFSNFLIDIFIDIDILKKTLSIFCRYQYFHKRCRYFIDISKNADISTIDIDIS